MELIRQSGEKPWFRILAAAVHLVQVGIRDQFFLSIQDLQLGEKLYLS